MDIDYVFHKLKMLEIKKSKTKFKVALLTIFHTIGTDNTLSVIILNFVIHMGA
jgi:hypothetical protein